LKFLNLRGLIQVAAGDTVQLDHDYCSILSEVATSQVSFYNCDSREYKSETEPSPAPLAEGAERKHWEKNSKKDSGLESGEVSDASDETAPTTKSVVEAPVCKNSYFKYQNIFPFVGFCFETGCI
jgi:hypothetical protein